MLVQLERELDQEAARSEDHQVYRVRGLVGGEWGDYFQSDQAGLLHEIEQREKEMQILGELDGATCCFGCRKQGQRVTPRVLGGGTLGSGSVRGSGR